MPSPERKRKRGDNNDGGQILVFLGPQENFYYIKYEPELLTAQWRKRETWDSGMQSGLPLNLKMYKLKRSIDRDEIITHYRSGQLDSDLELLYGHEKQDAVIKIDDHEDHEDICRIVFAPEDREPFINALTENPIPPSQYAQPKTYIAHTNSTAKLLIHPATDRPLGAQPKVENTLLCGIFRRFIDNVHTLKPAREDYKLAVLLRTSMAQVHETESSLRDAVNRLIGGRFSGHMSPLGIKTYEADGVQLSDATDPDSFVALQETKVDATGGAEPQFQAVHYYSHLTARKATERLRRIPLILFTAVGSVLTFSGAVCARLLGAYYLAVQEVRTYKDPAYSPEFPDVDSWEDPQHGHMHHFIYKERIPGHLLYRVAEEHNGSTVRLLVKFVRTYSLELHTFCAERGFAPQLKVVVDIGGGWRMVVMEDLSENYHSFGRWDAFIEAATQHRLGELCRSVQSMHSAGFVHGDIRVPNILVHKEDATKPLMLLDFDWGGAGDVNYPGALNPDIKRHDTADSGLPITAAHDIFMLNNLQYS
ncbi:hypothetical protein B0H16DRAFT_1449893 [Mycena metata]|uniref:Protein kinase domain-containing protein n=1 Tax=Mycena metata TaxID=1033252 RepID=A0AAD7NV64_9AGAR|nr:hypothetical protein B0H16DRAFT_1449893 [Mycena metata]